MPRKPTGPRLWFDKTRGTWTIIDGKLRKRTGFSEAELSQAEAALVEHIGDKHAIPDTDTPCIADVLNAYYTEHSQTTVTADKTPGRIQRLSEWWCVDHPQLSDITKVNCRAYVAHRKAVNLARCVEREVAKARREQRAPDIESAKQKATGEAGARADLELLRAAINYWHTEKKPLKTVPPVWLPDKSDGRDRWLTRSQIAAFLWASRRTVYNLEPDPTKPPRLVRYLSRFILMCFYTGSRGGVILHTRYRMLDFAAGFMDRKPHGSRKSKNKQAPRHKMPLRLKTWLLRWQRIDGATGDYVVHLYGERVKKPRRQWDAARDAAGLPEDVTPHILRHSRATHLMKNRNVANEDAAQFLGMTLRTFLDVYGHHDPEWQKDAADAR